MPEQTLIHDVHDPWTGKLSKGTRRYACYLGIFLILLLAACAPQPTSPPAIPTPGETTPLVFTSTATISKSSATPTLSLTLEPNTDISSSTPTPTIEKTITPTPSEAYWQLTFSSNRMGLNGIYAMDISCLDEHEVCLGEPYLLFDWKEAIPKGTNGGSPATINWSPDGTKVVISIENKLILANEDGEHAIYLTGDCAAVNWPKWSPDGGQIAFIFNPGRLPDCEILESSQIQLYNLETGEMQPILSDVLAPSRINWLPEGKMAYISRISETDYREVIRIVDREGKLLQQIPENPGDFTSLIGLDFSPDGNRLAFVGDIVPESGAWKTDIYISDLNTNSILNLTNGSGDNFDPVWAPTGDWIAFMSNREGNWDIYLIRPDGSGLINVTQNPASDDDPAWRLVALP